MAYGAFYVAGETLALPGHRASLTSFCYPCLSVCICGLMMLWFRLRCWDERGVVGRLASSPPAEYNSALPGNSVLHLGGDPGRCYFQGLCFLGDAHAGVSSRVQLGAPSPRRVQGGDVGRCYFQGRCFLGDAHAGVSSRVQLGAPRRRSKVVSQVALFLGAINRFPLSCSLGIVQSLGSR